jgi:hypothetical protein
MGGSKKRDVPENKVPLCRECHELKTLERIKTWVGKSDTRYPESGYLIYCWQKADADVVIRTPVQVSERYKCLVKSEVMPDASSRRDGNIGQREVGRDVGPLSDGAESGRSDKTQRTDFTIEKAPGPRSLGPTEGSAPSLSAKEESDGDSKADNRSLGTPGDSNSTSDTRHLGALTHDQRVAIAQEIKDAQLQRQWRAGDTANAWEEELGEDFWNLYANEFGYTYPSLRNSQRVSRQIPKELRNPRLSHSHHVVVAGLPRLSIVLWLHQSEMEDWRVAEFRRQVKGTKPKVKRWTLEELRAACAGFYDETAGRSFVRDANKFLDWLGEQDG